MRIVRDFESYRPDAPGTAVALGVFDGIHLGHQAILRLAVARARERGFLSLACTFDPHPMEVLRPARAPVPITTLEERLELIAATGIDTTVVIEFTPALALVEPETFVRESVFGRLRAREVVVGFNHTFGRDARGNAALLETLGLSLGFRSHVVPPFVVDGAPISSTAVRTALGAGDVGRAARCLGRPYSIRGRVVSGAGRGHALGFPTANLEPDRALLVAAGVYACMAVVGAGEQRAVVNVGFRPTFGGDPRPVIEAHLIDFSGALYGETIRLAFVEHLRPERKFPGPEDLRRQIAIDVEAARQRLGRLGAADFTSGTAHGSI